jgi:TetR/AcrR family transcriptional regulator, tetracycline repressor protein
VAKKREPATLTRDRVLATALAVGDADGLAAVSLRRIAGELGVTPMSVYNYVESKDALLDEIADRVYGQVELPDPSEVDWWDGLAAIAHSTRSAFVAHPVAAAVVGQRAVSGPNTLRILEAILALLQRAGFDLASAVQLSTTFARFLISMIVYEAGLLPELTEEDRRQQELRTRFELESLPMTDYPNLVSAAQYLSSPYDAVQTFEQALELLRAGIEAQRPRKTRTTGVRQRPK